TQKNNQPAPARRVAMKMGRRLRCSSVTYPFRYAPLPPPVRLRPPCRRRIVIATKGMLFRGHDTTMNDLLDIPSDTYFMGQALRQAKRAELQNEVPIGAVIVREQEII